MDVFIVCHRRYKFLHSYILFLLGSIGILAFAPYNFWPASIISMTSLIINVIDVTWKQAIKNALFWGLGFFGSGLYWIHISISQFTNTNNYLNIFFIFLLIIYLTLFPITFSIVINKIWCMNFQWKIINIIPILWSITEYLREIIFTGFPWLQLGYSQIDGPLRGIAPIFGVDGITFILVFISGLLAKSIKTMQLLPTVISISILLFLYPLTWIKWYQIKPQCTVSVSLIQGNIYHNTQWNIENIKDILYFYLNYTLSVLKKTQIIIWPESAIPGNDIDYHCFLVLLDNLVRKYNTNLITGIIGTRYARKEIFYNSIIVLGESTPYEYMTINRYDKHHLVLFSEQFPCAKLLNSLLNLSIVNMQHGSYYQSQLTASHIKITAAICYEIIFGRQIRNNFKFDTDFLLVIANNIWFGRSIEPWQYLQMVRMRALELGRPLLCSTNNGITAIINANGSIHAQLPQFISMILHENITPTVGVTPYAKFGPWLFWSVIMCIIYITVIRKINNTLINKNKI